jgi:hypothetical protein
MSILIVGRMRLYFKERKLKRGNYTAPKIVRYLPTKENKRILKNVNKLKVSRENRGACARRF